MWRLLNELDAFVGIPNQFIYDELNLNGIPTAGFVEELQRTFDNSMGSIRYNLSRGFLNTDGMGVSE